MFQDVVVRPADYKGKVTLYLGTQGVSEFQGRKGMERHGRKEKEKTPNRGYSVKSL
jgi:hypothetical protein